MSTVTCGCYSSCKSIWGSKNKLKGKFQWKKWNSRSTHFGAPSTHSGAPSTHSGALSTHSRAPSTLWGAKYALGRQVRTLGRQVRTPGRQVRTLGHQVRAFGHCLKMKWNRDALTFWVLLNVLAAWNQTKWVFANIFWTRLFCSVHLRNHRARWAYLKSNFHHYLWVESL